MGDSGTLLSARDFQRIERVLRWFERYGRKLSIYPQPHHRSVPADEGGTEIKIFQVQSNAEGDGIYNCYEQQILSNDWDESSGAVKIDDIDDPESVEVLNLEEYNPSAGQHLLSEGDVLLAAQFTEDDGTTCWAGLPAQAATGGGGGPAIGLVIESLRYANPPNDPNGQSYYTIRPIGTMYDVWVSGNNYLEGAKVAYPTANDECYHCFEDCPDSTTPPPEDTAHWEMDEEIRIEYCIGDELSPAKDLRNCVPWFVKGEYVIYFSRVVGGNTIYYLYQPFYTGEQTNSSVRWNSNDGRTMAVFK
jgi:hypothetical protein